MAENSERGEIRLEFGRKVILLWLASEIVLSILFGIVGLGGAIWLVGGVAAVSAVFAMVYATVRVLQGKEL